MDKYRQCNLNFEGLCEHYGEISVEDVIMICDTNEFLQYPQDEEQEDCLLLLIAIAFTSPLTSLYLWCQRA